MPYFRVLFRIGIPDNYEWFLLQSLYNQDSAKNKLNELVVQYGLNAIMRTAREVDNTLIPYEQLLDYEGYIADLKEFLTL